MVDYVSLAATAKRLIDANGRTVTLTKQGNTPATASKPWRGQSSPVVSTVSGKAVFVDPSMMGTMFTNEDNVKRGEQIALFAASNDAGNDLHLFDTITDDAVVWKILTAKLLAPASTRILYVFEVAR